MRCVRARLHDDRGLARGAGPGAWVQFENLQRCGVQLQALHAGPGEQDGVEVAAARLVHARGHIAADVSRYQVRSIAPEQRLAAGGGGAHASAGLDGQGASGVHGIRAHQQDVTGVVALQVGAEDQPRSQLHGQVLERVYGQVDAALQQLFLDVPGEEAGSGLFREGHAAIAVPGRAHDAEVAGHRQGIPHPARLLQGQGAAAAGDDGRARDSARRAVGGNCHDSGLSSRKARVFVSEYS